MVKLRTRRSMLLMLFFLILSVIFVVVFSTDMDSQDDMDGVYALQLSGSYCADGGEWTDFTSADELSGKACGELVMKVRFPEEVFENGKLHAMIRDVCVEIRSAGKQVYFNDYRSVTTGLTFNSYWISCALGEFSADGTAEIIFTGSDCRKTAEQFVSTACAGEDIYLFTTA